ncbi:MAG: penicillin-binding protein 1A [Pseudomonadota bacterium]|nr:penicillin-binding protein 1A [Pseudomonadota bacterium]
MALLSKFIRFLLGLVVATGTVAIGVIVAAYYYFSPQLPETQGLKDVELQIPLRVYSRDGALMAEYGDQRRSPIVFADLPRPLVQAVLAAEDDRFFEHPGVDYQGLLRAVFRLLVTGEKEQGGSTITMQVARNFFLSPEKTYERKIKEILLALKIERELSKEEVLELYLNKIYLGHRAYGVEAASHVYYGKSVAELELPQWAMIAGLPKAPSRINPITDPKRARERRDYVLNRMHRLRLISDEDFAEALAAPVAAEYHGALAELEAPYVAEMARQYAVNRFGGDAYTGGYRIVTSVHSGLQRAAQSALRETLLDYDRRHGYRGAVAQVELPPGDHQDETWRASVEEILSAHPKVEPLRPALVLALKDQSAHVYVAGHGEVELDWEGIAWARRFVSVDRRGDAPSKASDVVQSGQVVYASETDAGWALSQLPNVQGALLALDPIDGGILALVGGFDFYTSPFNRVIQAERQPGSSFKPFIYAAALDRGYTPATVINDAPVVFADNRLEGTWRPENYSGRFYGPTRLREALVHSRNLVSVRLLRDIGVGYAIRYASRFGFNPDQMPRDLSLSLGSMSVTPLALARGYSVFANGGFLVEPYAIERVEDQSGNLIYQNAAVYACRDCESLDDQPSPVMIDQDLPKLEVAARTDVLGNSEYVPVPPQAAPRVVDEATAYLLTSMMQDVVARGTGRRVAALGRRDLAGKTGTTNDLRDAWFAGYNPAMVSVAWVGFDQGYPLGRGESGGRTALPMWTRFVRSALAEVPDMPAVQPPGLVTLRISRQTGRIASVSETDVVFEIFRPDALPVDALESPEPSPAGEGVSAPDTEGIQELF